LWKQDVIAEFWKIEQGATDIATRPPSAAATALGVPPEERYSSKEKRKESLNQVFISVCELASNSFSATKGLEKYLKKKLTELSNAPVELSVPNPEVQGRKQNQSRFTNLAGPGSKTNKQQGHLAQADRQRSKRKEQETRSNKQFGI
jgi:hypothetical protein